NLWVSADGGTIWGFSGTKDWRTDLDYDGFDWGSGAVPFKYGGLSYPGLSSFAAASGLERAGLRMHKELCFQTFHIPAPPPTTVDFGSVVVGQSADRSFTVTNTGGGTLTGAASTSAPFSIVAGGSFSLGAGASQVVVVRFTPTTVGVFSANVSFTSNGGDSSRLV